MSQQVIFLSAISFHAMRVCVRRVTFIALRTEEMGTITSDGCMSRETEMQSPVSQLTAVAGYFTSWHISTYSKRYTLNFFNFILNREVCVWGGGSPAGVLVRPKSPAPDATVVRHYRGERMRADLRTISHVQPPQVTSLQPHSALKRHYLHYNNSIPENNSTPIRLLIIKRTNYLLNGWNGFLAVIYRLTASCFQKPLMRHVHIREHNGRHFPQIK